MTATPIFDALASTYPDLMAHPPSATGAHAQPESLGTPVQWFGEPVHAREDVTRVMPVAGQGGQG